MSTIKLIRPEVGHVIEHDGKVYECHKAERICKDCDFLKSRFNGTDRCVAPRNLECTEKIYKLIPRNSVILSNKPKKDNTFIYLMLITLLFWILIIISIKYL